MEWRGVKIDLMGLAQVLFGAAALATAVLGRRKWKEKKDEKRKQETDELDPQPPEA